MIIEEIYKNLKLEYSKFDEAHKQKKDWEYLSKINNRIKLLLKFVENLNSEYYTEVYNGIYKYEYNDGFGMSYGTGIVPTRLLPIILKCKNISEGETKLICYDEPYSIIDIDDYVKDKDIKKLIKLLRSDSINKILI